MVPDLTMTISTSTQNNAKPFVELIDNVTEFITIQQAGLTPTQIATAYNMPSSTGAGVKVGIISLGGGWLQSDLQKSMQALNLPVPTVNTVLLDGATGTFSTNDANSSLENTLDIYCIASTVPAADITIYIGQNQSFALSSNPAVTPTQNTNSSFGNLIQRAVDDGCDVISISWGLNEHQQISGNPYYVGDFLTTALSNAQQAGVTVLAASGDFGSASAGSSVSAGYPASSPLVTGVGGTNLTVTGNGLRATEMFSSSSGGGISQMFQVPIWQDLLTYKSDPDNAFYTLTKYFLGQNIGRGVPDISAPMNGYGMYYNGNLVTVGGTSASTPMMTGMVARFVSLSGTRMGNANAFFYQNKNSFNDITYGDDLFSQSTGYYVEPGWDPVSGLGAPDGIELYHSWENQVVTQHTTPAQNTTLKYGLGTTRIQQNGEWDYLKGMWITSSDNTWAPVKTGWVCRDDGTWERIYPTPKGVFTSNVTADGLTHTYYQHWPDSGNVLMIQNTGDADLTISNMQINDVAGKYSTFNPGILMPIKLAPDQAIDIPFTVSGNSSVGSFYGNVAFTSYSDYLGYANVTIPTRVNVLPDYNGIALVGSSPVLDAYIGDDVTSYSYSSYSSSVFTVPVGVNKMEFSVAGAGGGGGGNDSHAGSAGGSGYTINGILSVTAGDVINVYVGKGGSPGYSGTGNPGGVGGLNGAGYNGGNGGNSGYSGWSGSGGGGGGATVITKNGTPIIVAAGGGGGGGGGNWSYGYGQVSGKNGTNHSGANAPTKYEDGAGSGGGGGGFPGGIAGTLVGGDSGAYGGSDGYNLVPNGFTVSRANNAGGIGAGGNDGYALIKESGLSSSAAQTITIINSGNGADLEIYNAVSLKGYFAITGFTPNTTVGFDFNTYTGQTTQFVITPYATLGVGTYLDTLYITSNAVNHPGFSIPVTINVKVPNGNKIFETPGTHHWTVPPHVHSINLFATAGGGSGGTGFNFIGGGGGGGGSGGYQEIDNVKVTPGEVITVTVGDGGASDDNARARQVFPVSLPYAWNSFMNTYAVWTNSDGVSPVGVTVAFTRAWNASYTGSYSLHLSADNAATVTVDGTAIGSYSDFGSTGSFSFNAAQGNRIVTVHCTNYGGPAGVAATITDSNNNIVWTTRDLLDPGSGQSGMPTVVSGSFGTVYISGGASGASAYQTPVYSNYDGGGQDGGQDGTGDGAGDGGGGGGDGGGD